MRAALCKVLTTAVQVKATSNKLTYGQSLVIALKVLKLNLSNAGHFLCRLVRRSLFAGFDGFAGVESHDYLAQASSRGVVAMSHSNPRKDATWNRCFCSRKKFLNIRGI